ncbi:MAG: GNAT family N-acetyltransferase [Candidatus Riflebacteria bacterium]|nr:GNAT family N-acetyltransferase [Candidatus Riflebacteria bacterium]
MDIYTRELSPEVWLDLEKLFGAKGACGGCWCMSWRIQKGVKWDEFKGEKAREAQKELVLKGESKGILAYHDSEPVGWLSFGKRSEYDKLNRAPSLACDDCQEVWSIPCFFVQRNFRNKGVATKMLLSAVEAIAKHGGKIIEGYPSKSTMKSKQPDAFTWTGSMSLFLKAGFSISGDEKHSKIRVRKIV